MTRYRAFERTKKCGFKPIVIGDCLKVGRIADAGKAAYEAAVGIE